jgi:hypothetical protein
LFSTRARSVEVASFQYLRTEEGQRYADIAQGFGNSIGGPAHVTHSRKARQNQGRDVQRGCSGPGVGSGANVRIIDRVHAGVVDRTRTVPGDSPDFRPAGSEPGRWLHLEVKGLAFVFRTEPKTLG